jgi:hypothetical protein
MCNEYARRVKYGDPNTIKAIKKIMAMMRETPEDLYKYYGYGIYVGRKNEAMRTEV